MEPSPATRAGVISRLRLLPLRSPPRRPATKARDYLRAAAQSAVPVFVALLLVGNLFWVLAYDTEYAMVDRDDDLRIGIQTSAITLGRFDVAGVMLFYGLFIAVWGVLGAQQGFGWAYFAGLTAAALIALWHFTLIRDRSREGCFRAFRLNHWIGFVVFAGVVVDHALRR